MNNASPPVVDRMPRDRQFARNSAGDPPEDFRTTVYLFVAIWLLAGVLAVASSGVWKPSAAKSHSSLEIDWVQPLLDSLPEGVFVVDADTDKLILSNEAVRQIGLDPGSLVGSPVSSWLPPAAVDSYVRARNEARLGDGLAQNVYIREDRALREAATGSRPWITIKLRGLPCRIYPLKIPAGSPVTPPQVKPTSHSTLVLAVPVSFQT